MSVVSPNVRSRTYRVACASAYCGHCAALTRVLSLVVPPGHEILEDDPSVGTDGGTESLDAGWQHGSTSAILFYLEDLSTGVCGHLQALSRSFRLAYSTVTLNSYWANHCEKCGSLLEDHELHCEPGAAFQPISAADAANIVLIQIQEPLEAAAGGYAIEPEFFGSMGKS